MVWRVEYVDMLGHGRIGLSMVRQCGLEWVIKVRVCGICWLGTVHAAKCYDQSRLITWNFESHVTFLRGFCVDISRKYREFCVERGDRTWNSATLAWSPARKRLTVSVKKIICRIILPVWMNIALRLECYSTAAFRKVLIFFWNVRCGEIFSMKDRSFSVNHDLPCHNFECLHQLREVICIRL